METLEEWRVKNEKPGDSLPDGGVTPQAEKQAESETLLESLSSICTVLAIGLFLMGFVFQNYFIPSGSMEKTLLVGDHVLVDRITFSPPTKWAPFVHYRDVQRGDVIVFYKPNPETPDLVLVKRCIGVPGDHIHLRNGVVYLNGVAQTEPYAAKILPNSNDPQDLYTPARDDFPEHGAPFDSTAVWADQLPSFVQGDDIVVPAGKVFAMGDNRTHSLDGRFWGFVPRENILGRPLFNYWSYETTADEVDAQNQSLGSRIGSYFSTFLHIPTRTRWKRTLHLIR